MDNLTNEKLTLLYTAIDRLLAEKGRVLLAIDGPCTAGKTTLASILERHYGCPCIHMDQFFLRPEQRTPERLAEPGGNVDYERFYEEVLQPWQTGKVFRFRPFSCAEQVLGESIAISPTTLTVIEGTYSMHPYFHDPYDLKVFLNIDTPTQRERIALRPQWKQERFFREWIPMEESYFTNFPIRTNSDLIL